MIRAVIFDIDDTLYSYIEANKEAYAALSAYTEEAFGWEPGEAERAALEMMERHHRQMGEVSAYHNRLIRCQGILEDRGLPLYPHALRMTELYWDTLIRESVASPGAAGTMRILKERGIRLGIGTDMTALYQFKKLEHLDLLRYLDWVVTSEEACVEKPSPDFFALCVRKAGCLPEECLFVGDNYVKDYCGALGAGLHALWFVPPALAARREESEEHRKARYISSLTEIPELLDSF